MPTSRWMRFSSERMARRKFGSRAANGSSSSRAAGAFTRARAKATRWRVCPASRPRERGPKATLSQTVRWGKSAWF